MSNALALQKIEKTLESDEVRNKLIVALDLRPEDESAQREAFKYASSAMAEIKRTAGDDKRDLTVCSVDSLCQTIIDAAKMKLCIDGRQHAHIVKFGNKAQLMIGYRGYIAKIGEHYPDADFVTEPIFKGDKLSLKTVNGQPTHDLVRASAFADKWDDLEGVMVILSYTKGGDRIKKYTMVSKGDLVKMKNVAKVKTIWDLWPIEKAKAAAIKRASKIEFSNIGGLQEIVKYDNEMNFDLNQPATPIRKTIVDNINQSIAPTAEPEPKQEIIDVEEDSHKIDIEAIKAAAEKAADGGHISYKEWKGNLTDEEKDAVREFHPAWWERAKEVTLKKQADEESAGNNDAPPM